MTRRSRQARCPAKAMAAGIDAASMARRCQNNLKKWRVFFSTRQGGGAVRWAGACFAGGCATSLGIGALYTKVQDAAK